MKNKLYLYLKPSKKLIIRLTTLWFLGQVLLVLFFPDVLKSNLLETKFLLLSTTVVLFSCFIFKLNYNYYKQTKAAYSKVRRH